MPHMSLLLHQTQTNLLMDSITFVASQILLQKRKPEEGLPDQLEQEQKLFWASHGHRNGIRCNVCDVVMQTIFNIRNIWSKAKPLFPAHASDRNAHWLAIRAKRKQ